MNKQDSAALAGRKREVERRNHPRKLPRESGPVISGANAVYGVNSRVTATAHGGVALGAQLLRTLGLAKKLDESLTLLRRHRPYHESDHVIFLALAVFCGARRIEDLECFRSDMAFLNAIGAERLPDPTTAGDFLRRFTEEDVGLLQEAINEVRATVWRRLPRWQKKLARIDVDGTLVDTWGECKEGADFNYKKGFGYSPLVVSLANTKEPLYIKNREGNRTSNDDAAVEMEAAIELVKASGFERVRLRGDRAFSMTYKFDEWTAAKVEFVFSFTTFSNIESELEKLPEKAWRCLTRAKKMPRAGTRRTRPENVKRQCIQDREYRQLVLEEERYTEIPYRPARCGKDYRLIAVRKKISVLKGQLRLEDEIRYFLYLTNVPKAQLSAREVIRESNHRCDQEKLIEQMKNGVPALAAPLNTLVANWAWSVIASLPLSMKAWIGILHPCREAGARIRRMQYRRFLRELVTIPSQVCRGARQVFVRFLAYTPWAKAMSQAMTAFKSPAICRSG